MNRKLIIHHLSFIIRKSKGFTLIELLVVIGIIGILSSLLLANFAGVRQRSRDAVRKSDLRQIQSALELYRSDKGTYPETLPACTYQLEDGGIIYLRKIPCDPSPGNASYTYSIGAGSASYSIVACLENANDFQKDASVDQACIPPKTNISYTLQNP